MDDLIGSVFGSLTIISDFESYKTVNKITGNTRSQKMYLAVCECGNLRIVHKPMLRNQPDITCAECAYGRRPQSLKRQDPHIRIYKININSAKQRNLSFNLTLEEYKNLVTKNCYYCQNPPRLIEWKNEPSILANGIDRVNNNIGYELNNCVPCCKSCNTAKMRLSREEFLLMISKIYNNCIENNNCCD